VSAPVAPPSWSTASRLTASKYPSNLDRSWPPSGSPNSLDHGLQTLLLLHLISASKCISNLARSHPPCLHDYSLLVHLQTCSLTASKYISKLTRSRCDETAELPRHPKGIRQNEQFWFEEGGKRVREYEGIPGCEEPHKLRGSMKARQECMPPRAGKDRLCISFNEMMSI